MATHHPDGEPWEWQEAVWQRIIGRARAGRNLKPDVWPGGARCAVCLSFDVDHETIPLRDGDESPMRISQGQFGARQGMPRIREILRRHGVPATFFYPAVSALIHPAEALGVRDEGHEIGMHSWIHESNLDLPAGVERELALRSMDSLRKLLGEAPLGMRTAAWDFSGATLGIIQELELLYDSSLMSDDDPYELETGGQPTGIVELPPEWIRDDAAYFSWRRAGGQRPYTPPSGVEEIFLRELDGAWNDRGLYVLTMHPHHIGHRSRVWLVERVIEYAKDKGGCWFATHAQAAAWCKEQAASADSGKIGEGAPSK